MARTSTSDRQSTFPAHMRRLSLDSEVEDPDNKRRDSRVVLAGTDRERAPAWAKGYASDGEAREGGRRLHWPWRRKWRETPERLLPPREVRRRQRPAAECRVLVRRRCGSGRMTMSKEEVRACRELNLGLPCDELTVVVPSAALADAPAAAGGPPDGEVADWRIVKPGDDPKEVKARLKVWAQAVALMSVARAS